VSVLEMPPPTMEVAYGPYKSDFIDMTNERMRELKARTGIQVPHVIAEGLVPDAVREEALNQKADLIVTGRGQDLGMFSRAWSHLYPIIRHAPCPVLSI
jgi:nucleotide-binding universal stress UspA family protein